VGKKVSTAAINASVGKKRAAHFKDWENLHWAEKQVQPTPLEQTGHVRDHPRPMEGGGKGEEKEKLSLSRFWSEKIHPRKFPNGLTFGSDFQPKKAERGKRQKSP